MAFRCCHCTRNFVDENALRQHLQDKRHYAPKQSSHVCEKCNKSFPTTAGLKQHRQSIVHNPLSNLHCVGKACRTTFQSPSALIQHLEGGSCPSGWTREKINSTVHMHNTSRILTNDTISLVTMLTSTTTNTSTSTFSDLVIPTPSEWSVIEEDDVLEQALVPSAASSDDESPSNGLALFCPLCLAAGKTRVFKDSKAMNAHISSATHAGKAFKCPRAFTGNRCKSLRQKTKSFTTLGGLTQHLESGRCKGGKPTLWKTLDFLQKDIFQFEWPGRLLKN